MSGWTTERGDEWWYESPSITATAGVAANIVSIEEIRANRGLVSEDDLRDFISESKIRFKGSTITISLNSPHIERAMLALRETGIISFEVVASRYFKSARLR